MMAISMMAIAIVAITIVAITIVAITITSIVAVIVVVVTTIGSTSIAATIKGVVVWAGGTRLSVCANTSSYRRSNTGWPITYTATCVIRWGW